VAEEQGLVSLQNPVEVLNEVDKLVFSLGAAEANLEIGYVRVGKLLQTVSEREYYIHAIDPTDGRPFHSFGAYMVDLARKYHRGHTQLYSYMMTVRELSGEVTEEQLGQMGITKAKELRAAKKGGLGITPELVATACDPGTTRVDLRRAIFSEAHMPEPQDDSMQWFDLGGIYLTRDERRELDDVFNHATAMLNLPPDMKEPSRIKAIILAMVQECYAEWIAKTEPAQYDDGLVIDENARGEAR
jgi:hypothetical protein